MQASLRVKQNRCSGCESVLRNDTFSRLGKYYYTESRISSLWEDFLLRSCSALHSSTSVFDFTVCECRQPGLSSIIHLWRLFNSRRSPGSPPMSRSAQPNFLSLPFFSFTSLFRFFSPRVCLTFMPQTFHPLLQHTLASTATTNPSHTTILASSHLSQSWGIPSLLRLDK